MLLHRVRRAATAACISLSFVFVFAVVALAQDGAPDRRQNTPGAFDFYVLALSWSPSYCAELSERRSQRRGDPQCSGRPYAFVVHGLWPQYEKGFPSYCQVPAPRLDRAAISRMLDLMPSPSLVIHEWDRHGTCSGLSIAAYFETVRKARAAVKIPEGYVALAAATSVIPDDVAEAFVKANPGLDRADMAIACDKTRLTEVRICVGKDFSFHACPDVARRSCKREKVEMPAVRGERAAASN